MGRRLKKFCRSVMNRIMKPAKPQAKLGDMIRMCPGKRHAWFESEFGSIRKPIHGKRI